MELDVYKLRCILGALMSYIDQIKYSQKANIKPEQVVERPPCQMLGRKNEFHWMMKEMKEQGACQSC